MAVASIGAYGGTTTMSPPVASSTTTTPTSGASSFNLSDLFGDLSVGGLLGSVLGGAGYLNQIQNLRDIGRQAQTGAQQIGQAAAEATRFVPFTVTGTTGAGITTTPEGSTALALSPEEQALQQQLFGGAGQFISQAQQPIAQTEQDIFNRLMDVASPQRQQQQLALEERLAAQGRLGTSSAAYGGATPEQLALSTAQEQQMNQLALQARNQALAEQQQAAQLGQGMLGSAYLPQSALLNVLQGGLGTAALSDVGRRQAAQIEAEAGMGGLDALLQANLGAGNLTGQGLAALANLLGGATSGLFGSTLGSLFGGGGGGTSELDALIEWAAKQGG